MSPRIRLGTAPDSWGVWHPADPRQTPWNRFLDEVAAAGYQWIELGPYGYLPTDPLRLLDEVAQRGLRISGQAVQVGLHREGAFDRAVEDAKRVASLVEAVGASHLVMLPEMFRSTEDPYAQTQERTLDAEAWQRLTSGMTALGKIVADDHGVRLAFHPHADSHVESQAQVERFLCDTEPDYVALCLDTGHVAYGGGDNVALIDSYPDRIGYVHLKQVDPDVLDDVRAADLSFAEAVQAGVCTEPPAGVPEMRDVVSALAGLNIDLFAIVEQDLFPCDPDVPLPIARRTRRHLRACGLGPLGSGH
ncbi:MAG: TIM barrel protein [Acidobacteria bacterium]|nr:TIM barrel protein [Acidobacteriota bacterium]